MRAEQIASPDLIRAGRVEQVHLYRCSVCGQIFNDPKSAKACADRGYPAKFPFTIGDPVTLGREFGWWDASERYVYKKEPVLEGESSTASGFWFSALYFVTAIEREADSHRPRIHLVCPKGPTGEPRHVWTVFEGHRRPMILRDVPAQVLAWWRREQDQWRGLISEHLS